MGLLTVAQLREHVETSLPDTALERILASSELAIAAWVGPHEFDTDDQVEDVTETVAAPGRALLRLCQVPTDVPSAVDVHRGAEVTLDSTDYRVARSRLHDRRWHD